MIYITGDTHGVNDFEKLNVFAAQNGALTKNDYVIVAGDCCGMLYADTAEKVLSMYEALPFTVLFVDGNHENYDYLYGCSVENWKGGKVHKLRPSVIHLMRGQVFSISGKTFFSFGGATSIDRANRIVGLDWWEREVPNFYDLDEGIANLNKYHNKVDYIVTHSCGERSLRQILSLLPYHKRQLFPENQILTNFESLDYRYWYFGHFHLDAELDDRTTALYRRIVKIETET